MTSANIPIDTTKLITDSTMPTMAVLCILYRPLDSRPIVMDRPPKNGTDNIVAAESSDIMPKTRLAMLKLFASDLIVVSKIYLR